MKIGQPAPRRSLRSPTKTRSHEPPPAAGRNGEKYADIQADLERQRAAILQEVEDILTNRKGTENFPDVSDQASAETDQNFSLRIREREQRLLKKIDEALGRLASHTYGICESCGNEIPYKRLKARPVTTLCIECKTSQEEQERSRR
ncbi:MAG TPA: RNA polymerase-binding protein DksA [Nitrospiraceae bacterium]|jgi:DnaK suppressor protein|nr:RNA polymerase-binding protein DksA [Nitrospiraceae bacterium]